MKHTEINLQDAVVAVTGGGRGIGRATAVRFAARGAVVHIGDLDLEVAEQAAEEIGGRCSARRLDVADRESFSDFLETSGPLDVLVNNAGIMPISRFLEEGDQIAHAQFDVNVFGPMLGMKLALPGMIERGHGHVVNVASYAGKFAIPGLATYCASKAALIALNEVVALELVGTGVTVSAVLPSAVRTELSSGVPFPFERQAKVSPEAVAKAIVGSLDGRPLEVAVPGWLGNYERLAAVVPTGVERMFRAALGDDRALTKMDPVQRAAYLERVARQTDSRVEV